MYGPRGFHTNDRLKVKFIARSRKIYHSKTKKPLDSIRRQKCGAHFKGFTFSSLRKVKDSLLALRALNSMVLHALLINDKSELNVNFHHH